MGPRRRLVVRPRGPISADRSTAGPGGGLAGDEFDDYDYHLPVFDWR